MTEASRIFFSYHKLGALLFCLILNKYIFTFLCYIHYVNILKVIKEPCTCCCSENTKWRDCGFLFHTINKHYIGCIWHVFHKLLFEEECLFHAGVTGRRLSILCVKREEAETGRILPIQNNQIHSSTLCSF